MYYCWVCWSNNDCIYWGLIYMREHTKLDQRRRTELYELCYGKYVYRNVITDI